MFSGEVAVGDFLFDFDGAVGGAGCGSGWWWGVGYRCGGAWGEARGEARGGCGRGGRGFGDGGCGSGADGDDLADAEGVGVDLGVEFGEAFYGDVVGEGDAVEGVAGLDGVGAVRGGGALAGGGGGSGDFDFLAGVDDGVGSEAVVGGEAGGGDLMAVGDALEAVAGFDGVGGSGSGGGGGWLFGRQEIASGGGCGGVAARWWGVGELGDALLELPDLQFLLGGKGAEAVEFGVGEERRGGGGEKGQGSEACFHVHGCGVFIKFYGRQ